jgi:hypothetical protein
MTYNTPSNFPQEPVSGYVEQVETFNRIEDGIHGAVHANEIRERIAREIGHVAVNSWTSQG